ncbi:MAG: T9SS type A sorting domain-containing protein, partial [Bacteroidia bacterium]|nr:T9SS type A sorting domain-containing protein [Bacteroidia bacterium]
TDANGCTNTITSQVTVNVTTGLVHFDNGSNISVFPNPAHENVTIKIQLARNSATGISIYDLTGREVIIETIKEMQKGEYALNVNRKTYNLQEGIYYLRLVTGNESKTIKLIFN